MDIFHFRQFNEPGPHHAILTVGNFDGVHLGHQALICQVVQEAREKGLNSALLTFQPHPQLVLRPDPLPIITTMAMRLRLFESYGLDSAYFIPFNLEFSKKTPEAFVKEYLLSYFQVRKLIIGFDFHFGRDRAGSAEVLTRMSHEFNFDFEVFPEYALNGEKVSSSRIRRALLETDFPTAEHLLGRPFSILEKVVSGEKRGRSIGFPTINQASQENLPIPYGVYVSTALIGGKPFSGISNYGIRPTVGSERPLLETHLFDVDLDLYGEMVEVIPHTLIRSEMKFTGLEALKRQIAEDQAQARQWHQHHAHDFQGP